MISLFDPEGELLTLSTIQPSQSILIKTAISTYFDFSDFESMEEASKNPIQSMTLEFEVTSAHNSIENVHIDPRDREHRVQNRSIISRQEAGNVRKRITVSGCIRLQVRTAAATALHHREE